ncbi:hypothetical protein M885DRAFT_582833 [Pelagophyceae sp. CCMP2097]|nr:hypothetical protein M885DRAFT_582833 [Pelagophyceae sp. CCMP2097]|mmetsp:Transcript_1866/g.6794  ORF Transcript_1866/g.6794 Transcript_1866/m.6794 type:complete len:378 (-) Transcript_1866:50-1183(-)
MARGVGAREAAARDDEAQRRIRYEVVTNDGSVGALEKLTDLKNIFATQLPKMPREYIARLVFDKRHRSLALVKGDAAKGDAIIGGVCYRPYYAQQFLEIAFLGISASEQVRGFGTRVMNHLKERAKAEGILYFLTYADNFAIGYFKKQGFSKSVSLPKERWSGYIKDYDGGTLMECYVHPTVNYLELRETLAKQRLFVAQRLEAAFLDSPVYTMDAAVDVAKPLLDQIPGLRALGFSEADLRAELANPDGNRRDGAEEESMAKLLERTKAHDAAWPFQEPVDTAVVQDYLSVISDPVDLRTLEQQLEQRQFSGFNELKAELLRMLANCRKYNGGGVYVKAADALEKFVLSEARVLWEDARRSQAAEDESQPQPMVLE